MNSMDLKKTAAAPRLVIATRNRHKTAEFSRTLGDRFAVEDLTQRPDLPEPVEDGATFEENARIKALAAARALAADGGADLFVLADDSGLEVDALDGAPGVRSARYSGEGSTDASNREKLLAELEMRGIKGKARTARFRCALALARNGAILAECDGAVEGLLGTVEKGDGGFGYDPLFIPEGRCETFAQIPPDEKNAMSHRGRAIEKLRDLLRTG
jgi:XTP/dITP diphosphohydrolase